MDSTHRRGYRTLFQENKALLRAMLVFNASRAEQDRERLVETLSLDSGAAARLAAWPRACRNLTNKPDPGFWDFQEEARRILLLDRDLFVRAVEHWGACFYAPVIWKTLNKADQTALKAELGDQLTAFAMGRARFYLGRTRSILPQPRGSHGPDRARTMVLGYGTAAFRLLTWGWPGLLRQTLDDRIHDLDCDIPFEAGREEALSPSEQRQLWGALKNILLREVAPQWTPCFS